MNKRHKDMPHQRRAIRDIVKGFKTHRRGQAIMACATGKTHVGQRVSEVMGSKRIVVFVPSLALIAQFIRNWADQTRVKARVLAVCCDTTVAMEKGADNDDISTKQLIADTGVDVTTDPDDIAKFMKQRGPFVIFCTYLSSGEIAAAQRRRGCPSIDMAICDEAHRCASHISGPSSTIVRPDAINARYRLFMTATPRYFRSSSSRDEEGDLVAASMDNPVLFGPVFHELRLRKAIELGLVCDYQVIVSLVTDKEVARLIKGRRSVSLGPERFEAQTLATHIAADKAVDQYKLRKLLSFHSRITKAKDFAHQHELVSHLTNGRKKKMWVNHIRASTLNRERLRILNDFENQPAGVSALLTNARCLTEGVDVPAVDGVVFVDPRESIVAITQAIGRALRKSPGKKIGTIVIPVFAEELDGYKAGTVEVTDEVLAGTLFATVRRVIMALRVEDDELDRMFSKLTERSISNGGQYRGQTVNPRYVPEDVADKGIKAGTMVEAPAGRNIVDHVKGGRTYDKKGREVVVKLPDRVKFMGNALFSSAITNKVVRWGTDTAEVRVREIAAFYARYNRAPYYRATNTRERTLHAWSVKLRRAGKLLGYKD